MGASPEKKKIVDDRINKIIELFNKGYGTYSEIYEYAKYQNWDVQERQIQNYIKKAYERMTDLTFMKLGNAKGYTLNNLMYLKRETIKRKEFDAAFKIEKEIAKIAGAYDPVKEEEVEDKIIIPHTSTKEDLRKRIENEDF